MKKQIALAVLLLSAGSAWSQNQPDLAQSYAKGQAIVQTVKESAKSNEGWSAPKETPATPAKLISFADLLRGASTEAKLDFLESLTLVDGKVASAKIDALKAQLGEVQARAIISAINPHPKPVFKESGAMNSLAWCDEHECNDAACRPSGDHHACLDARNHLCFDTCH